MGLIDGITFNCLPSHETHGNYIYVSSNIMENNNYNIELPSTTKIRYWLGNSGNLFGTLQLQKETLSSLPFVPGEGSKAAIYCSSICTNPNGTIVSVHSDVTNTVNTRFRRNLRSDRKRRVFKT